MPGHRHFCFLSLSLSLSFFVFLWPSLSLSLSISLSSLFILVLRLIFFAVFLFPHLLSHFASLPLSTHIHVHHSFGRPWQGSRRNSSSTAVLRGMSSSCTVSTSFLQPLRSPFEKLSGNSNWHVWRVHLHVWAVYRCGNREEFTESNTCFFSGGGAAASVVASSCHRTSTSSVQVNRERERANVAATVSEVGWGRIRVPVAPMGYCFFVCLILPFCVWRVMKELLLCPLFLAKPHEKPGCRRGEPSSESR